MREGKSSTETSPGDCARTPFGDPPAAVLTTTELPVADSSPSQTLKHSRDSNVLEENQNDWVKVFITIGASTKTLLEQTPMFCNGVRAPRLLFAIL